LGQIRVTLNDIAVLLVGLLCAGLFILLFQFLFPRRAPWKLVACAFAAGLLVTYLLTLILKHSVEPTLSAVEQVATWGDSLRVATFRAALPEEATKSIAALLALLPFWRRATPAASFQAALIVAVGFAVLENRGYAAAFSEYGLAVAVGRGLLATFVHATLAMTFGLFLMRFVASGWTGWHHVLLGYLAASALHAVHNTGLLMVGAEMLRTGNVTPETIVSVGPVVLLGFGSLLVSGLWSLRVAIRRAAIDDPITTEPWHQAVVRRWRRSGNIVLVLGVLCLGGPIAWTFAVAGSAESTPVMMHAIAIVVGVVAALFAFQLGWVLRQKR
jgi:RsiW-degrading membrane proteinase PrsW (M82 family)